MHGAVAISPKHGDRGSAAVVDANHQRHVSGQNQMRRIGLKYGLATMCIGGGQGMAMIIEREA